MSKAIEIVLASDNNYAQHLAVTIVSVLENNTSNSEINFHILENGLKEENKVILKQITDKHNTVSLKFYNIDSSLIKDFPEIGHLSKATYLRLFIPDILPQDIEKVIYLDCDLVVLKDLKELYNTDLGDRPLGAVRDVKSKEIIRIYFYPGLQNYFNAGMLLINTRAWREAKIKNRSTKFIEQYHQELSTADQDALNCLFANNWLEIHKKYNTDPKHEVFKKIVNKDTVILHYSDKIKPWSYLYTSSNKKYYFKYLRLTPYFQNFRYQDKDIQNILKKYPLAILKKIKNILRPVAPSKLIDLNKERFLKKQINARTK